ncbi:protein Cep78 homolog [Drosophila obscura]|uniref:protein Cep78 homolog n=1 Tax=Drosophila obscura TaxID=7282 RepID=UPI001BB1FBA4|nr:protein Cep78 homolog [Drosophila obscura]
MSHSRVPGKVRKVTVPALVKKSSKSRSFYFRYLELCRAKNLTPVPEIRKNSDEITALELCADKLNVSDWLQITEALHSDQCLKSLLVRMRRSYEHNTIDPIDTENRARLFTQRPVLYTRFIFRGLVQSIANCVASNKNLTVLQLEGVPLYDGYIDCIAKSLEANTGLETLSFRRSLIGDKGCELVCNSAKYLNRIALFDLSECRISAKGAVHVAEMIKIKKAAPCTEGWKQSILGLGTLLLANNPDIGDPGLQCIAEALKEDAWIKVVDMQGCGLTDIAANVVLDCLALNRAIKEFNVRGNEGISQLLQRNIRDHLGSPDVEEKQEPEYDLSCIDGLQSLPKGQKFTISQLRSNTKQLEQRLSCERTLRLRAEEMNIKLTNQLKSIDSHKATDKEGQASSQTAEEQPNSSQMKEEQTKEENDSQSVVESIKGTEVSHSHTHTHIPNEHPETNEEDHKDGQVTSPEMTPRSDLSSPRSGPSSDRSTLCDDEDSEEQYGQSEVEPTGLSRFWEQQKASRLQVQKVRSEKKNAERNVRGESNKIHESNSNPEFAKTYSYKFIRVVKVEKDIPKPSVKGCANPQGLGRNELCGDGKQDLGGGPKQGRGRNKE